MKHYLLIAIAALAFPLLVSGCASEQTDKDTMPERKPFSDGQLDGLITAPQFPAGLDWLNTEQPIRLKDLRGKFVLLDFWTYCCINCLHVIPELKALEKKYADELVVIGVHSGKFPNEQGTENIRNAVLRHGVEHPVVNDKDFQIWEEYTVGAWPTLVLINPVGKIISIHPGEGPFMVFDPILSRGIPYFKQKGLLQSGETSFATEASTRPRSVLSFPGKITADAVKLRLYISDSNNNRIVITDTSGAVIDVIGNGRQGRKNGGFEQATLNHPQGTWLEGDILYIADTENHMVRAANLKTRTVETVFGTGEQARYFDATTSGKGVVLRSPWDVLVRGTTIYIAMAGSHQIWAGELLTGKMRIHAGSGREGRMDNTLPLAALAQPSGLTSDGIRLYFADSETSSIRYAAFDPKGKVGTIIGEDLFEFGDADGDHKTARLQHPLGIVYADSVLYVADTYNSKIKKIDIRKRRSMTFSGVGRHGFSDGGREQASFYEPGGLANLGGVLYIADTNNDAIRVLDKATGTVRTLQINNLERLNTSDMMKEWGRRIVRKPRTIKEGPVSLSVVVSLPKGYKLAEGAPHAITWSTDAAEKLFLDHSNTSFRAKGNTVSAEYDLKARKGDVSLIVQIVVYYCKAGSETCHVDMMTVEMPLKIGTKGERGISIPVQALGGADA